MANWQAAGLYTGFYVMTIFIMQWSHCGMGNTHGHNLLETIVAVADNVSTCQLERAVEVSAFHHDQKQQC
jgi:hypothetical protein